MPSTNVNQYENKSLKGKSERKSGNNSKYTNLINNLDTKFSRVEGLKKSRNFNELLFIRIIVGEQRAGDGE